MLRKALKYHRVLSLAAQSILIVAAYVGAFLLRFDFRLSPNFYGMMMVTLPLCYGVKILVLELMGVNGGLWHYAGLYDLKKVVVAVSVSSLAFMAAMIIVWGHGFPRSVYIIDYVLCLMFLLGIRVGIRLLREELKKTRVLSSAEQRRVLIIGAGDVGETATRMLERDASTDYRIVGFLDDDRVKHRMLIRGYPILGATSRVLPVVREHKVTDILFAISDVPKKLVNRVVESCASERLNYRILPVLRDIITGATDLDVIRPIELKDLLGREQISLDTSGIENDLCGCCVMVTGAGGSIGGELCRQILRFRPKRLVMLDVAETPLFDIDTELRSQEGREDVLYPVLCSVLDERTVEGVIRYHGPSIIYHAAAYKHVPMLERYPLQAVVNNIFGTQHLLQAAARNGVRRFVMISTDKAVRPSSVMGATKRLAEMLVTSFRAEGMVTTAVRFGNVLGSNGSVVPIFRRQIERGGPIMVTHPEMTRFFMTIPEAVELVLHAGSMGCGGEVFILDMGEPVKVVDLARKMIELSGKIEGADIVIEYSGIRPGEKMYEELVAHGEDVERTSVEKIMMHRGGAVDAESLAKGLCMLRDLIDDGDETGAVNKLWEMQGANAWRGLAQS